MPRYIEVAVQAPLRRTFHYIVPDQYPRPLAPGVRVRVPFGHRTLLGYVLGPVDRPRAEREAGGADKLKPIDRPVDAESLITPDLLDLARWMSDYYFASLGETLAAMLPADVRRGRRPEMVRVVELTPGLDLAAALGTLSRAKKQAQLLSALRPPGRSRRAADLLKETGVSAAVLSALVRRGLVNVHTLPADKSGFYDGHAIGAGDLSAQKDPSLNPARGREKSFQLSLAQKEALSRIERGVRQKRFGIHLLLGVTGSGKTEVYLRALAACLDAGRRGIVLVPEIALTPQTVARFSARFGQVAVLHSHLTDAERALEWRRIRAGEAPVAIGARSAVFAPMPGLGLVIIDEEHENSFKQDSSPRYHARDVAIMRAQRADAAVILGSATPSLESYLNARRGRYQLCVLPTRVAGRPLPPVEAVDMRDERGSRIFSHRLAELLSGALARGEQAILFLNRRGFHTFITCPRCDYVAVCEHCDIALTFHREKGEGRRERREGRGEKFSCFACHHCGRRLRPFDRCPQCGAGGLLRLGRGTQRIEDVARRIWPEARIRRMDSDVMRTRLAYEEVLGAFGAGQIDMLVGTQMIAKGLDFPNVTVVGIMDADVGLNLPDFRASERTFQLIAQVAGRTARGERGGRVIVQTRHASAPAVSAALSHDFERFARAELDVRRDYGFPPFKRLARVILRGPDEDKVKQRAVRAAEALRTAPMDAEIRGPAPCPITRLRGDWRYHVLLHAPDARTVAATLRAAEGALKSTKAAAVAVDVDPVGMM